MTRTVAHRESYIKILFFQDFFYNITVLGHFCQNLCKIWTWIITIMRLDNLHAPKYLCVYAMCIHHKFVNGFTFDRSVYTNCFFSFLPGTFDCFWWLRLCWPEKYVLILFFFSTKFVCFLPAAWDSRALTSITDIRISFIKECYAFVWWNLW